MSKGERDCMIENEESEGAALLFESSSSLGAGSQPKGVARRRGRGQLEESLRALHSFGATFELREVAERPGPPPPKARSAAQKINKIKASTYRSGLPVLHCV